MYLIPNEHACLRGQCQRRVISYLQALMPLLVQVQAAPSEVPREPAGLNEQLFAQMLQAQQAATGGESSGAEPGSADKQGSAADSKKKVPVMLKGARLAFSRPGIISGRQPGPNRPSPGSQVCTRMATMLQSQLTCHQTNQMSNLQHVQVVCVEASTGMAQQPLEGCCFLVHVCPFLLRQWDMKARKLFLVLNM